MARQVCEAKFRDAYDSQGQGNEFVHAIEGFNARMMEVIALEGSIPSGRSAQRRYLLIGPSIDAPHVTVAPPGLDCADEINCAYILFSLPRLRGEVPRPFEELGYEDLVDAKCFVVGLKDPGWKRVNPQDGRLTQATAIGYELACAQVVPNIPVSILN